ncbi:hypothetical protein G6M12_24640 [Agrobacterium tumefaciens]|nr:hypothetical protein ASD74_20655 [Rhizobium sp. Root564]NTE84744.1 hypothetical protein [Agrobacterium tumefaciens]
MSAVIELQIEQPPTRTTTGHGAVVTVRQVADDRGSYPDEPFETAVLTEGIGGTDVVVPAGRYRLEARFPDGRTIRENRNVANDKRELVRFESLRSPHEWLVWQTLSGNVPQFEQYGLRRDAVLGPGGGLWQQKVQQQPSIRFLSVIATMTGLEHFEPVVLPLESASDDTIGLWTTRLPDFLGDDANAAAHLPRKRIAAVVRTSESTLLAFLPGPWGMAGGEVADIEILIDPLLPNDRALRISVVDGPRSALLSYLGSSRMYEASVTFDAGRFGEEITTMLYAKRQNPYAAAAAAYAGLSFPVDDPRRETWSPWLANLMNWFPELPDGAILFARDRLDRAMTKEDLVHALEALKLAYHRGPPVFAVGVRHLLDGLAYFRSSEVRSALNPGEFETMYRNVESFAGLVDATQTFTVLKLPREFLDV